MDSDFWISLVVCLSLLGVALWLIRTHYQHWLEVDADTDLPDRERDHLKRRYRRRMQTSTMVGFVGVALLAGRLFPPEDPSLVTLVYWTCVALLVLWMALLALADMIATRVHYSSQRRKVDGERAKLQAQLRRFEEERTRQPRNHHDIDPDENGADETPGDKDTR